MIEDYFNQTTNGSYLLADYRSNGTLNDSQRVNAIQIVVDFMIKRFGEQVSVFTRKMVARATVGLFKCWIKSNSKIGGIVSTVLHLFVSHFHILYFVCFFLFIGCFDQDLLVNRNGGWLNARYNHVIFRNRRLKGLENAGEEPNSEAVVYSPDELQKSLEKLKRLPVNVQNLPEIRNLLNKTRDYRCSMLKPKSDGSRDADIKENFPFFFTHPETTVSGKFY